MLILVNLCAVLIVGGAGYLLEAHILQGQPSSVSLAVAICFGLLVVLVNYWWLIRKLGVSGAVRDLQDLLYLMGIFAASVGTVLTVGSIALAQRLPQPPVWQPLGIVALWVILLATLSNQHAARIRTGE